MASCLGLYIENNLIKYAKVSKEKTQKSRELLVKILRQGWRRRKTNNRRNI